MKPVLYLCQQCATYLLLALFFVAPAAAQYGLDVVNQEMKDKGLFSTHIDNCASSEAFVPIGMGGTAGPTGFCIEKSERGAATWHVARQTCAEVGKRLPESIEFKYACNSAGGLSIANITDDWEWGSNFYVYGTDTGIPYPYASNLVTILGNGGCDYVSNGAAGSDSAYTPSYTFRCVH